MKVLVIYNPVSGLRWLDSGARIKNFLQQKNIDFAWFETKAVVRQNFADLNCQEYDRVLVAGGDGTVHEVAQYFIEQKITVPLAVIPIGSANILALTLGVPLFPLANALDVALSAAAHSIDAIGVNRQYFALICAGQGYDSSLIAQATRKLKKQFGFGAYIISFIRTFFTYFNHHYSVVVDGKRHEVVGKIAIVLNGLSVLGLPLDKKISPSDGVLDLVVFNPRSIWDILHSLFFLLWKGANNTPRVQVFSGKEMSINQHRGKSIQVDGEVYKAKNLQISVRPAALQIVYNKKF